VMSERIGKPAAFIAQRPIRKRVTKRTRPMIIAKA
jgi:hypothetical protein